MGETEMVYVTKFALSNGIERVAVEIHDARYAYSAQSNRIQYVGEGKDWHRTFGSASTRADSMRQAKIASLKKQIAKLEKLTFKDPAS